MRNLLKNIKKGWVTSIIGSFFLLADFVYFIFPMMDKEFETDSLYLLVGVAVGVGLLLAPDELIKKIKL